MLIAGKPPETHDLEAIASLVTSLPSGFSERTTRRTDNSAYEQSRAYELAEQADRFMNQAVAHKTLPQELPGIFDLHNQAVQIGEESGNPLIKGIALARRSAIQPYIESEGVTGSILSLHEAVGLLREAGAHDHASIYAGDLHHKVQMVFQEITQDPSVPDAVYDHWEKSLYNVRLQAAEMFRQERGEPEDEEAYRIEQGEVGFSSEHKIGTDGVAQCVGIAVHNPDTKKTAVAHIDFGADIHSLDSVLEKLGYEEEGTPLLLRMVGGNDKASSHEDLKDFYGSVAHTNFLKLLDFLKDKNVDIISADIFEEHQPHAFVVDPESFTLAESLPTLKDSTFYLSNGWTAVKGMNRPLRTAFDQDKSMARTPFMIDSELALKIQMYANQHLLDIYNGVTINPEAKDRATAERVESILSLTDHHVSAVQTMASHVIDALERNRIAVDDNILRPIMQTLATRPIYVGPSAELANQPLVDFIKDGLLTQESKEAPFELDIESLASFELP